MSIKSAPVFLRAAFNYDADEASLEAAWRPPVDPDTGEVIDDGKTQQSFKEEVDINTIVRRFGLTGELPPDFRMPVSGDFTGVSDFHSAMNMVRSAQEAFMQLPGEMRDRFGHDPAKLMSFLEDSGNRDEALKLGLIAPPPEVTRDAVMAIDELAKRFPESAKG
jgi:phage internal scaffolding protein